jgi:hypothetical protein
VAQQDRRPTSQGQVQLNATAWFLFRALTSVKKLWRVLNRSCAPLSGETTGLHQLVCPLIHIFMFSIEHLIKFRETPGIIRMSARGPLSQIHPHSKGGPRRRKYLHQRIYFGVFLPIMVCSRLCPFFSKIRSSEFNQPGFRPRTVHGVPKKFTRGACPEWKHTKSWSLVLAASANRQ